VLISAARRRTARETRRGRGGLPPGPRREP
jgi:hypothetical protein